MRRILRNAVMLTGLVLLAAAGEVQAQSVVFDSRQNVNILNASIPWV